MTSPDRSRFRKVSLLALAGAVLSAGAVAAVQAAATAESRSAPGAPAAAVPPGADARAAGPQRGDTNHREVADDVVFAIHGGAGTLRPQDLTPEMRKEYEAALTRAVKAGYDAVRAGKEVSAAVRDAIVTMEDSPLFNAGKGAVFTTDADNELDASIMDGRTLDSGAVTGVKHIKNPIGLARDLMRTSNNVMMSGAGAELYAQHRGIPLVTKDYFFTERRWKSLMDAKAGGHDFEFDETNTVGAVARDRRGNLAAGTSTGGRTNKSVGRIGDSPVIGAGTYADNRTVAVSATGTGELFIRRAVAHDISASIEYRNTPVVKAADGAIDKTEDIGGADTGGVIALDRRGRLAFVFNTSGMYRGYATADGDVVVKIFADE